MGMAWNEIWSVMSLIFLLIQAILHDINDKIMQEFSIFCKTFEQHFEGIIDLIDDICLTSVTRAKCGFHSTLCWKIPNISGSTKLFAL